MSGERNQVLVSSGFGSGDKYHKLRRKGSGVPACQDIFPQGTVLVFKKNAKMDGFEPCQHPACYGER